MGSEPILNSTEDRFPLYNSSLELASYILNYPSLMLFRLRRLKYILSHSHEFENSIMSQHPYASATAEQTHTISSSDNSGFAPMPGPSGFLTSWYFAGVVIMVGFTRVIRVRIDCNDFSFSSSFCTAFTT